MIEKVKENRLRRKLNRMGYRLEKNRIRDTQAWNYGGYMILDSWTNKIVHGYGPGEYTLSIDDVEEFIKNAEPNKPNKKGSRTKKDDENRIFQLQEVTSDDKDFEDPELKDILNEIKYLNKLD